MKKTYDLVIVGSGPTGLGAAFHYMANRPKARVLILDRNKFSSGGLRNDCKMNFTYPVGFSSAYWTREVAEYYLNLVMLKLQPDIMQKTNVSVYAHRAARLGVELLDIRQTHLGTDGGVRLIKKLLAELEDLGVELALEETMISLDADQQLVLTDRRELTYEHLLVAPGRGGFRFLQDLLHTIGVHFIDNVVDIGVRVETRREQYPIVSDYYDPKFHFPAKVRTFCTNSGSAYVVKEKYESTQGRPFFSVNGHSYSDTTRHSGLVNFAMLKTVNLTEPLASGQEFAEMLGMQAMLLGGGQPIMQRVGDFRLAKRSKGETFTGDLYDFEPSLKGCTAGDISLAMPSKILRAIWKSLKQLDTIVPGILHPSTILYYPEIKLYANKPTFQDRHFRVRDGIYMAGDGAGTSRGITAAWASGIRAADGMLA
ncbi:MAG: pyridine nucleotide-disulfide oxidoreductase [Kiritimatiellae bacterium]|nr:pyridine nucleotide-disulfide oxidoreductase [Kiritimatiellia bacterium]